MQLALGSAMSDAHDDTRTTTDALTHLMSLVTEKRTLVQFQIAEKSSRTYRIKAPSWRAAKEMIDDTHDNAGNWSDPDYEDDYYYEVDGHHEHIDDYKPTFDEKIKQVKIGYQWYDLSDLVYDPTYYLARDTNISEVSAASGQPFIEEWA
jgi:hypothetical protein